MEKTIWQFNSVMNDFILVVKTQIQIFSFPFDYFFLKSNQTIDFWNSCEEFNILLNNLKCFILSY